MAGEPRIAARLEHTLGETYRTLGLLEEAESHLQRAVEIRERELGKGHADTLDSMESLAGLLLREERAVESEDLLLKIIDIRKREYGTGHAARDPGRLGDDGDDGGRSDQAGGGGHDHGQWRSRVRGLGGER